MGAIESFLRTKIGLDPRLISPKLLERVLRQRMESCRLEKAEDYFGLLSLDEEEQGELIEAVLVPETWFFRDLEPFLYLQQCVRENRWKRRKGTTIRVLSIPASTGEEPYSIAIALMSGGLAPEEFSVDAVEIGRKAIEKARLALYRTASFRERNCDFWRVYFTQNDQGFRVKDEVRSSVRFLPGNVLELPRVPGIRSAYDIIFFRNLLIYLDQDARKKAAGHIDSLLKEDGLLFLGYAEPQQVFFPDYKPVDHARSYASKKLGSAVSRHGTAHPLRGAVPLPGQAGKRPLGELPGAPDDSPTSSPGEEAGVRCPQERTVFPIDSKSQWSTPHGTPSGSISPQALDEGSRCEDGEIVDNRLALSGGGPEIGRDGIDLALEKAQRLADSGDLSGAAAICRECIKLDPVSVRAHYLLGITALGQGEEARAREDFNRVVYLDPCHVEALIHLSLLMERAGQREMAERYRKRAERVRQ